MHSCTKQRSASETSCDYVIQAWGTCCRGRGIKGAEHSTSSIGCLKRGEAENKSRCPGIWLVATIGLPGALGPCREIIWKDLDPTSWSEGGGVAPEHNIAIGRGAAQVWATSSRHACMPCANTVGRGNAQAAARLRWVCEQVGCMAAPS